MSLITTPKIGELILMSHNDTKEMAKNLSKLLDSAREMTAAQAATKTIKGVVYSGSLFDDATDNIFYHVYMARQEKHPENWSGEIRFIHNATQLFSGIIVQPSPVQPGPDVVYDLVTINNITFPRAYTHLLLQAITKLSGELGASTDVAALQHVAILSVDV